MIEIMLTVIETPSFSKLCADYWSEAERQNFAAWIAANPEAGNVIPGSGGCRKIRWSRSGVGKRGGVRIIYYNQLESGHLYLLLIYAKSVKDNIPAHMLLAIKETIDANE